MAGMMPERTIDRGTRGIANRRRHWIFYTLLLLLLIAASGRVGAQVAGCDAALQPVTTGTGSMTFILALDGLRVPAEIPGLEDPKLLIGGLRFKVDVNLEALEMEPPASGSGTGNTVRTNFKVVACPQRQPEGELDMSQVNRFLNNNVVLELWGMFDGDEAIFSHAILPIYVNGAGDFSAPREVFHLSYPYQAAANGGQRPELKFLKKILLESLSLRAYSAVGAAALALQKKEYDLSWRFYCSTHQILLDQQSQYGELSKHDKKLLEYAQKRVNEVIDSAMSDPEYKGALGSELLSPGTGCGGLNS
jgi:hypothetical protein